MDRGDPLNLRTGNPFLLPELINSFELNLQQRFGKGTFTGGVYYRAKSDLLTRVTETLPGGIQIGTQANLDSGRDYGVELITTYRPTKKLDLTASANGYRTEIDGTLREGAVQASGFNFDARLQGSYELPWDVRSQFTYFYRSPGVTPQGRFNGFQGLDLGFRKPILNDLGAITLRVTDLFNQRRFGYSTEINGLSTVSEFQRESRIVYVGFQYSLRPVKGKQDRRQGGGRRRRRRGLLISSDLCPAISNQQPATSRPAMAKPSPSALKARILHRYLGFFLAGIMAIYAISGIVLIFRNTDAFKQETAISKTVALNLEGEALGQALDIRRFRAERTEGDIVYFKDGTYNRATGQAAYTVKELPFVLDKMTHLHKATTNDPLYFLNIFFGLGLLFFVISAFWMYLPGGPILRKGLWFTAGGIALTLLLLFV